MSRTSDYHMRVVQRMKDVDLPAWQALQRKSAEDAGTPFPSPFTDPRYLCALEDSGSVGPGTGWTPLHVVLEQDGAIVAAAAHYAKTHSWGEYVFDWAWADAHERHGHRYYPKGLVAIPFTPVPGPRLLASSAEARAALIQGLIQLAQSQEWSSMHWLFPPANEIDAMRAQGLLVRSGYQFHWENPGYADFDAFLAVLKQPKRKKILAERRKVREADIVVRAVEGEQITDDLWSLFYQCHQMTYALHRSTPYLERSFFEQIGRTMPEHLLMFVAEQQGRPIATSLLLRDSEALYGRYWGALEYVPCLHFETAYYAPMEWAIRHGIRRFEGGAQGEHKMARGFMPTPTWSAHWLSDPSFEDAIARYLERETGGVEAYLDELDERSPLKAEVDQKRGA